MALELANQEEAELLSVISDVKGFLKRPEGIPAYVSKEELFGELSKIVKSHNSVSTEKKVEAIEVSGQLLKAISSRKYRRRNSHVSTDVTSCLDIVIPTVILQLGSRNSGVSQASLKLIQQCLQNDDQNLLDDTIEQIAGNGIRHKSDKISHETMKLVPGIYAPEIEVMMKNDWQKLIQSS